LIIRNLVPAIVNDTTAVPKRVEPGAERSARMTKFTRVVSRLVHAQVPMLPKEITWKGPLGVRTAREGTAAPRERQEARTLVVGDLKQKRRVGISRRQAAGVEGR
jgi:hypothetical protein